MVELVSLVLGLAGELEAQFLVGHGVGRGEDLRGVGLAPPQGGEPG